ncbi:MAG: efflux RND transporter periplasmic adaptor subunit [Bacteroidota bacterium]
MEQAKKNLQVQQDLYNAKLSSERDLLSAQKELQKMQANLTRSEELFKIYNVNKKSDYLVTAPIPGFITEKRISRDMLLRSDNAQSIFTLAQIDEVWVIANVYESDISRITEGMDAEIRTLSYPEKIFKGKVDKIFNVLDPQTKTLSIRIKLPNPGFLLKPEMVATVTLYYKENQYFPAIPSASVIFDKSKNFVMVFHDRSHVETREITIYKSTDDHAYISSGLKTGERIISKNQLFIYDELND